MSDQDQEHTFHVEGVDDEILNEALKSVEKSSGGSPESAKLEARIAELEAEAQAKTDEAAQWKDKYVRSVADLDNFRKRALREKEEARLYGAESLLRDLLNILDNMERALEATGDVESIKQGVKMTHDQFKGVLRQHGVEVIEASGSPFDPAYHEAVAHVESGEHAAGTVMQEHRRGYTYRERLLRASMVSVAKPQAAPGNPQSEPQSES